jgi:serine/threonine-protein kinase RsbW
MERSLQYRSEIQAIPLIRKDLEDLARAWEIPDSELRQIMRIMEELFSNSIRFAFQDGLDHTVNFLLARSDREISIEMIDDGIPFDPLSYQPAPASDPAASDSGGMGLTLVRIFSDSIEYSRKDHRNHLLIRKTIRSNPENSG